MKRQKAKLLKSQTQGTDQAVLERPSAPQVLVKAKPEFIQFGKPDIGPLEKEAVANVLDSGWLSTGPVVKVFEEEFAKYMGSGSAVAVSSATMGLMLSMAVCGIGDNTEILTSPLTFPATINAILAMRCRPVFVDVDTHGTIDPNRIVPILRNGGHRINGIMPVHYAGASCDMREILHLGAHYGLKVIEDAAHSFGGEYVAAADGDKPGARHKIGTIGDYSVFSFYPTKNITAGEGGMVMTKHADMAERIRTLAMQGLSRNAWHRYGSSAPQSYELSFTGYKGNLSDVHAAIGLAQLRRWPDLSAKRTRIWNIYEDAFGWKEPGHSKSLFTIRVKDREMFRQKMHDAGIGTGVHYNPVHLEPGYRFLGHKIGAFPMAERIGATTVSLPINTLMTEEDAHRVVAEAKKWMGDNVNA